MMIVIIAAIGLLMVFLERRWAKYAINALEFQLSFDRYLAQPQQPITCSFTVINHGRLPIPFVRVLLDFPRDAIPSAEHRWNDSDQQDKVMSWYCEHRLTIPGRRSITRSIKLSFPQRGEYTVGGYHLSAGDLLGFREESRHGQGQKVVIMPRLSDQITAVDAVGGFLGDVSVRRFILEDPILTVGFRDYTGREPMRSISWTRTAQAGTLQVKQYDHTAEHHVVVLLNTDGATERQLEECLRLTRSACEKLEQRRISYGFLTNANLPGPVGKIQSMTEGLGQQHLNTILYGLGGADKTCYYSFRRLVGQTLKKRKSNESYVVITPVRDEQTNVCLRRLSSAAGAPVCVLVGSEEVQAQ